MSNEDRNDAFWKFCYGNTTLLFSKLILDKYNVLDDVTVNFQGTASTTSSGVVKCSERQA